MQFNRGLRCRAISSNPSFQRNLAKLRKWRQTRPYSSARIIRQEALSKARKQNGQTGGRTVNTPGPGCLTMRPDRRHRRDKQALSSSTSSGRGESEEGSRSGAVVTPRDLPSSDSHRRIPASCPFPRNRRRQLRATPASLAAPNTRPETSSCFHHPRYNLGEERNSTRPCLRD